MVKSEMEKKKCDGTMRKKLDEIIKQLTRIANALEKKGEKYA